MKISPETDGASVDSSPQTAQSKHKSLSWWRILQLAGRMTLVVLILWLAVEVYVQTGFLRSTSPDPKTSLSDTAAPLGMLPNFLNGSWVLGDFPWHIRRVDVPAAELDDTFEQVDTKSLTAVQSPEAASILDQLGMQWHDMGQWAEGRLERSGFRVFAVAAENDRQRLALVRLAWLNKGGGTATLLELSPVDRPVSDRLQDMFLTLPPGAQLVGTKYSADRVPLVQVFICETDKAQLCKHFESAGYQLSDHGSPAARSMTVVVEKLGTLSHIWMYRAKEDDRTLLVVMPASSLSTR